MVRRLLPVAVALGAAAVFSFRRVYDPDLFWHIAGGQRALAGHVAYASAGFDWLVAHLVGVSDAPERSAALGRVLWLQCGLLAGAFMAIYAAARARGSRTAAFAVLLVSLLVIEPRAMPRPYLFSFIGLALCAWFAVRHRSPVASCQAPVGSYQSPGTSHQSPVGSRQSQGASPVGPAVWASVAMALLIVVWSNFHSEAVFGVALIGIVGVFERSARLLVTAALGTLATLCTPYGIGMWRYLVENAQVPALLRIAELQPPQPIAYPAFFMYLIALGLALLSMPKRARPAELAVVVLFAALGLRFVRFTPMIVCAAAPILADRVDAWLARGWDRLAALATAAAVVVVSLPASPARMLRAWKTGPDAVAPPEFFSANGASFIRKQGLAGPVFNSLNLGGYLEWTVGDRVDVFVDSRLQAWPADRFRMLIDGASDAARFVELVDRFDWAVVSFGRQSDLAAVRNFNGSQWAPVFLDEAMEILVKKNGRYGRLAQAPGAPTSSR